MTFEFSFENWTMSGRRPLLDIIFGLSLRQPIWNLKKRTLRKYSSHEDSSFKGTEKYYPKEAENINT